MRDVHTRIPDAYWQRAVMNNLRWHELLCFAIEVQTDDFNEEKKILKKVTGLENEIKAYKKQLKKLEEVKAAKKEAKKETEKLKENSCSDCGVELGKKFKNMGKGIRLCQSCFMSR